jgi:uncharacterized repeat protein (TIGR01451 family)
MKFLLSVYAFIGITTLSFSQVCTGDFAFYTQTEVDQFVIDNPTCTTIDGSVYILQEGVLPGYEITNVSALSNITEITGSLIIERFDIPAVLSLSGFSNLTSAEALSITEMNSSSNGSYVTDLTGLEGITNLGVLTIICNTWIDLSPLYGLTSLVGLNLDFPDATLSGYVAYSNLFPNLISIDGITLGSFGEFSGQFAINDFSGFDALTTVGGFFCNPCTIDGEFSAFHHLQTVNYIFMDSFEGLTAFAAFEELHTAGNVVLEVTCDCDINYLPKLAVCDLIHIYGESNNIHVLDSVSVFPGNIKIGYATSPSPRGDLIMHGLADIQGDLIITGSANFGDDVLYWAPNLTHIGGSLEFFDTASDDLSFLDNVVTIDGAISIVGNQNLTDCAAQVVCERVANDPFNISVSGNGSGCSSLAEVSDACSISYASGVVFGDLDCDGIYNNDDVIIHYPVMINSSEYPVGISQWAGYYLPLDLNSSITYTTNPPVGFLPATSTTIITEDQDSAYVNNDFALCPIPDFHDLQITMTGSNPVPGFNVSYYLKIKNNGVFMEQGTVVFDMSMMPGAQFFDSNYPSTTLGNFVTFDLLDLDLLESTNIRIKLSVEPTVPLGTTYTPMVSIAMQGNTDSDLQNNAYSITQTVVGSYDPNDITVSIETQEFAQIPTEGLSLDYTIRFQNTGTAPAQFVRVTDIIEEDLDISSFEMLSASHTYELTFNENGELEWYFDNIQLPDSSSDLEGSQGYIHYRITTVPNVVIGDVIENAAAIYFDYNEPVITNTATTIFYECPEELVITTEGNYCEGESIVLLATYGWDEYSWTVNDQPDGTGLGISIDNAAPGIYFITCEGSTTYCTSTAGFEFFVAESPDDVVITGDQSICEGENFELTASGAWDNYSWIQNGEVISNTNTLELIAPANGASAIELVTTTENCEATLELTLFVSANPAVTIEYNTETQLITGPTWYMYDWYINGVLIEEENLFTFDPWQYAVDGFTAYAVVTGPNNCTTTTNTVSYVGIPEGVENFIEVYPNPMTESTLIKLPSGNFEIELFNAIGQRLNAWSKVQNSLVVNRDQLTSGTYLLKMTHETGIVYSALLSVF